MQERNRALALYGAAMLVLVAGMTAAAGSFPGGFDWAYTVISALMSQKHNPAGGIWFAGAFAVAMVLLLPVAGYLERRSRAEGGTPVVAINALRVGFVLGAVLGVERLFIYHLSDMVRKAHELLALLTFLCLYWGVLGMYVHRIRRRVTSTGPLLVVVSPILAVCLSQLVLYLDQRGIGWADVGWKELGVPVWLSFAFWQWVAAALLWIGLGYLLASGRVLEADARDSWVRT